MIIWALAAAAVLVAVLMLIRELYVAPYCCERCERPTPYEELTAHGGFCRQCSELNR